MSRTSRPRHALAETVAPYLTEDARVPHTKLSISLPTELVALVREAAASSGTSVSATIAAAVRKAIDDLEQARVDAALAAQNEENLEWAKAYEPVARTLLGEVEW